jgi:hypothetical protein
MVSAALLATIPWAPEGPLPRSTVPVHLSSARRPGPRLERIAETWTRTLPDGAVCLHARGVLVRSDRPQSVALDPPPGWRLLDAVGAADGTWTIAELVPGPPDVVRLRRLAPDGETLWRNESIAGSAEAARELLTDGSGALWATTAGELAALDAETGRMETLHPLPGVNRFMNGRAHVGYLTLDAEPLWHTLDVRSGEQRTMTFAADAPRSLDLPLGVDAGDRPYGNRHGVLVRLDADGRPGWELPVAQAIIAGDEIWIQNNGNVAPLGGGPVIALPPGHWRLVGRRPEGTLVLHATEAGSLTTVDSAGATVHTEPAAPDVWMHWPDLQTPRGPAVTDAGEIDLATRTPEGLQLIRIVAPPE